MRSLWLVLLLLPTAQALEIDIESPDGVVLGVGETMDQTMQVTITCTPMDTPTAAAERTLHWRPESPHTGLLVTGKASYVLPATLCVDTQELTLPVNYTLSATQDVPGEQTLRIDHDLSIESESATLAERKGQQDVMVAYHGLIQATSEHTVKKTGPQKQITYEIEVTNLGNARTTVKFELAGDAPTQGQIILPEPLILEGPTFSEDTTKVALLRYSTPFENGNNNAQEAFTILVKAESSKSGDSGENEVTLEFVGQTSGLYVPSPFAFLPLALVGAALLRRR